MVDAATQRKVQRALVALAQRTRPVQNSWFFYAAWVWPALRWIKLRQSDHQRSTAIRSKPSGELYGAVASYATIRTLPAYNHL